MKTNSLCRPARPQAAARRPAQLVLFRIAVPTTPAQTVSWSIPIFDLALVRCIDIRLRAILQEIAQPSIAKISLKIISNFKEISQGLRVKNNYDALTVLIYTHSAVLCVSNEFLFLVYIKRIKRCVKLLIPCFMKKIKYCSYITLIHSNFVEDDHYISTVSWLCEKSLGSREAVTSVVESTSCVLGIVGGATSMKNVETFCLELSLSHLISTVQLYIWGRLRRGIYLWKQWITTFQWTPSWMLANSAPAGPVPLVAVLQNIWSCKCRTSIFPDA